MKLAHPRFYFSFRSPYSWIGARLLEEEYNPKRSGIEYIPFWEPDKLSLELLTTKGGKFLYTPMSREKHFYILQDIKRITSKLGYSMSWPIDSQPWWEMPHLAYLAARRQGKQHEFFWAVYQARWERGENICSVETIRNVAVEVGLPPDQIAAAPYDASIREEGAEMLYKVYRDGVFGVPFFIVGHEKFWGIDRLDDFKLVLAK
ncbi:MAG: hypothetical protein C6Y22_24930 [Hapalosiphonaceae cyanobacterium JJU2]|jgi:2-hydroxychromene-2-carboxylate isomerase|nr:MAG: hypothetical protein C6Y22_24930 [Hapalosiphonaceae cyanobacterium JJU2]